MMPGIAGAGAGGGSVAANLTGGTSGASGNTFDPKFGTVNFSGDWKKTAIYAAAAAAAVIGFLILNRRK